MARCPFAIWRPLNALYVPGLRKVAHNRMSVHITAGLGSPWGFFNAPGRASSEYFVYLDGRVEQYGDSVMQFEADLDGNDATHSVENEGRWGPLTAAQVATNARLFRWLRDTHGIANRIATDSRPGPSSHGLAWHRLGIDGNFPPLPSPLAGRLQRGGGMRYSTSRGKECPTAPVILQIPEIFRLSQPTTPPPPEDDVPLTTKEIDQIASKAADAVWGRIITRHGMTANAAAYLADTRVLAGRLDGITVGVRSLLADRDAPIDYEALARAIVAQLPTGSDVSADAIVDSLARRLTSPGD